MEIRTSDIVRLEPPVRTEESKALARGEKKNCSSKAKQAIRLKPGVSSTGGGKEVSRELLSHDRYRPPTTTVYRIGIGPPTADESEDD